MELPGAQQRVAHFEGRAVHDYAIRGWLESFLDHWIADQPVVADATA
jgi:GMP synthase (glutamine-hydrolysing)